MQDHSRIFEEYLSTVLPNWGVPWSALLQYRITTFLNPVQAAFAINVPRQVAITRDDAVMPSIISLIFLSGVDLGDHKEEDIPY